MKEFPFKIILDWYTKNGRHHLPWRAYFHLSKKDLGYHVWLSEIILQQTQAERCVGYYNKLIKRFPTVEELAETSYEEFFPYYKGLGYYSRAKNMLKAAKYIVEFHNGIFPENTQDLVKIPGVGPYTAQAIRAFAYDVATLSFDTNLEKVFSRFFYGSRFHKLSIEEKQILIQSFEKSGIHARDINAALMDFASTVDINNLIKIDWGKYPLKNSLFFETRGALEPEKQKKQSSFPTKEALVFAILHENHKIYFSSPQKRSPYLKNKENFGIFSIGKNTGDPRKMIQSSFLQKYGLEVSVRPPEVKSYLSDETPYLVCYTQIQSGKHSFKKFEGLKIRGDEEKIIEKYYSL